MDNTEFTTEEIKGTVTQIEYIIQQIGRIDISINKHKTLRQVDEDDVSVASYRQLRQQFVQQLADIFKIFDIQLQAPNAERQLQQAA
jgi:Asp-tRNA(Asn)/Glu-tRNA(Gln) amidotransferase C subunit